MPQLGPLDPTIMDAKSVLVAAATVQVYREGATISGDQAGVAPLTVTIRHPGKIITGDTVFIENDNATTYSVGTVTATTIQISGYVGALSVLNGQRIVPSNNQPAIYSDDQGGASVSQPLTSDLFGSIATSGGLTPLWMEGGAYHVLAAKPLEAARLYQILVVAGEAPGVVYSGERDGATAVAHVEDTRFALVTAGAKLKSWRNLGVERNFMRYTGVMAGLIRYADSFPGADAGAKIAAAIADLPVTGGTVDARGLEGVQTFTTNPFAAAPQGTVIFLGVGTYTTTAQVVVPDRVRIVGCSKRHTIIMADPSFAAIPLIRLGPGGTGRLFDMRLENLYVHCNNLAGTTGVYSTECNEGSGLFNCLVAKYRSIGVNIETTGGGNAGTIAIEDCEITGSASGATSAVRLNNVDVGGTFDHVTINMDGGTATDAFDLTSCKVFMSDIHIEKHTNGINFKTAASGVACQVSGVAGVTNLVNITSGNQGGIALFDILPSGATNAIADALTGRTITTSSVIAFYLLGGDGTGANKVCISSSNLAAGYWRLAAPLAYAPFTTLTDLSTTPSVAGGNWFKCSSSSATTITNFTGGLNGQKITIEFTNANTTIQNAPSIFNRSGANITPGAVTTRSYIFDGSSWFEVS